MTADELIKDFYPLTYTREIAELRCGMTTLGEHRQKGLLLKEVTYLWDLVVNLKTDLEADIKIAGYGLKGKVHPSVAIYSPENVLVEAGAEIEAGTVLDARSGPIYIGQGTIVRPLSYLRGPLSIGPECRIGGEVTHSIFHGYSNKAHYGFIGHSYVGEWVNLGAGTTNSNLKNNYGNIKVSINNQEINTREQFLGCFIGDYAKLGIGTLITTGAVIGVAANLFGGRITPKAVPSFSWGMKETFQKEKAIMAARVMMQRRGKETVGAEKMLAEIFEATEGERKALLLH